MFRILLVEQNQTYRSMLKTLLVRRFPLLEVDEAGGREQALRLSDSMEPDLVVMDVQLQNSGGLELTRLIKRCHPLTAVVALSSYDFPEYRNSFKGLGADYFVPKSAPLEELMTLVKRLVKTHKVH